MSLVIAIKDKDRIVLGADKQVTCGFSKDHSATKIWNVPGLPGALMGGVGSLRANQIIQYTDIIDKNALNALNNEPDTEFVVRSLAPTICATLDANGICCHSTNPESMETGIAMPSAYLFAYKDKAWMIFMDLSVTEIEDYLAVGSGSEVAKGALFATQNQNPFERIVTALGAASESTIGVDDGVDLLVTEERSSDVKNVAKAFGVEIKQTESKLDKLEKKKTEIESGEDVSMLTGVNEPTEEIEPEVVEEPKKKKASKKSKKEEE